MTIEEAIDYCERQPAEEFIVVRDITLVGNEIRAIGKRLYVAPNVYDGLAKRHNVEKN